MGYDLVAAVRRKREQIEEVLHDMKPTVALCHVGSVISFYGGVAQMTGLKGLSYGSLVSIGDSNLKAITFDVTEEKASLVLLQKGEVSVGSMVRPLEKVVKVPVGESLIGRVISPLGTAFDDLGTLDYTEEYPIERPAPEIIERKAVNVPLQTGIKIIDGFLPIGRGQRELILGDRQTGKSTIAIDTILNQKGKDVICIYCSIGQRLSSLAKTIAQLRHGSAMDYSIVVAAHADDPPGVRFICPYAATCMAEWFVERGKDVLIAYDDITSHARAYREITLLLRRPPGREAFPADIFYIHARLLERSANRAEGGSLTALPIVETQEKNISAYIPTNLISITDGQIFLSKDLFGKAILPAIAVGESVSRISDKAQLAALRQVAEDLKLQYAQFEEQESFGAQLQQEAKKVLQRGRRVRHCLKQNVSDHYSVLEELLLLLVLQEGLFDDIPLDDVTKAEGALREASISQEIADSIMDGAKLSAEQRDTLVGKAKDILSEFQATQK